LADAAPQRTAYLIDYGAYILSDLREGEEPVIFAPASLQKHCAIGACGTDLVSESGGDFFVSTHLRY
jgi:hypothetical protein